jgi:hypothetical protein
MYMSITDGSMTGRTLSASALQLQEMLYVSAHPPDYLAELHHPLFYNENRIRRHSLHRISETR